MWQAPKLLDNFFNHNVRDIDLIWSKEKFIEGPNSVEDEEWYDSIATVGENVRKLILKNLAIGPHLH